MASKSRSVLYVGVTNNLYRRAKEHKEKLDPKSFCGRYNVNTVVYAREFEEVFDAIRFEKKIKRWKRSEKKAY